MSIDFLKCIPAAIPTKRQQPKTKFNDMSQTYTADLQADAKKTSQLFRHKISMDLERALKRIS